MQLHLFKEGQTEPAKSLNNVLRSEVPIEHWSGSYMVMQLDADDSFDLVVQYPDGEREVVWSLIKERQE